MTEVCLLGSTDDPLRQVLRSHETAREALATYDVRSPFVNTVAVETVSLGAAVALLNDLSWYLVRYVEAAMVREPSVSESEWLSADLARAVRDETIDPAATAQYLRIYGVERPSPDVAGRLVEPMYVTRTDGSVPTYDLRDVDETLVVRVTPEEFGGR
ncbi:MAG: DUF5804 family protein [Halococcoides sp.]